MKDWNPDTLSKKFESTAINAMRYVDELSFRLRKPRKENAARERELYDEHWAKWFVYDSFVGRLCLESREQLLAEAKARLARGSNFVPHNVFNKEDFEKFWRQEMALLIKTYERA